MVVLLASLVQYVFKTEPYTATTTRTVHEELAKAMTAILKPSTDFLTCNKLLKVTYSVVRYATEKQRGHICMKNRMCL